MQRRRHADAVEYEQSFNSFDYNFLEKMTKSKQLLYKTTGVLAAMLHMVDPMKICPDEFTCKASIVRDIVFSWKLKKESLNL